MSWAVFQDHHIRRLEQEVSSLQRELRAWRWATAVLFVVGTIQYLLQWA
jgi:hypothetical protein